MSASPNVQSTTATTAPEIKPTAASPNVPACPPTNPTPRPQTSPQVPARPQMSPNVPHIQNAQNEPTATPFPHPPSPSLPTPSPRHSLSPRQLAAARLFSLGQPTRAVAAHLALNRRTLSRWQQNPLFQSELARLHHALTTPPAARPTLPSQPLAAASGCSWGNAFLDKFLGPPRS